jgi:hypothetical protein
MTGRYYNNQWQILQRVSKKAKIPCQLCKYNNFYFEKQTLSFLQFLFFGTKICEKCKLLTTQMCNMYKSTLFLHFCVAELDDIFERIYNFASNLI